MNNITGMTKPVRHGYANHPLYAVWRAMKQRCTNPKNTDYHNYGGRGITICTVWRESAGTFIEWAIANGWAKGLQIDRTDNDGDYHPANCRFVTHQQNSCNQRKRKDNTSGYRGVSFHKRVGKFVAQVRNNGEGIYVGYYTNPVDAAVSRDSYIISNDLDLPLNFEVGNPTIGTI